MLRRITLLIPLLAILTLWQPWRTRLLPASL